MFLSMGSDVFTGLRLCRVSVETIACQRTGRVLKTCNFLFCYNVRGVEREMRKILTKPLCIAMSLFPHLQNAK